MKTALFLEKVESVRRCVSSLAQSRATAPPRTDSFSTKFVFKMAVEPLACPYNPWLMAPPLMEEKQASI
jgi:hypothetical protein